MSPLSTVIDRARERVRDYRERRVRPTESDTIQIYKRAVLPDGRLLGALRNQNPQDGQQT